MKTPLILTAALLATAPLAAQDFTPAPKPSASIFAAIKPAIDQCFYSDHQPANAKEAATLNHALEALKQGHANKVGSALLTSIFVSLVGDDLPFKKQNWDKLTAEQQADFTASTGLSATDAINNCASHPDIALPVLRWMSDDEAVKPFIRSRGYALQGFFSSFNVGGKSSETETRALYLKAVIVNPWDEESRFHKPRYWSDGIDEDLFANIKRQRLQRFYDRELAGPKGDFLREYREQATAATKEQK